MAFPLLAIGAAAVERALPGGLHRSGDQENGLFASFGSLLGGELGAIKKDAGGLSSRIAGLLASGVPMASIIDRISQLVSNALAKATGNEGNADGRQTLQKALAGALAPPGSSASSLESRLSELLSKLSGQLQNAGQQSRFSGAILDAASAKETPAQQTNPGSVQVTPSSLSLAETILQGVLGQMQTAAPSQSQSQQVAAHTPQPASAAQTATPPQQNAAVPASMQSQTAESNILGRMLGRAFSAQLQQNAGGVQQAQSGDAQQISAVQNTGAQPSPAPAGTTGSTTLSPAQLFARLASIIEQSANQQSTSQNGDQSSAFTQSKAATPLAHSALTSDLPGTPAFGTALSTASAPAAQNTAGANAYVPVDPQAVIEQLVKGISMQTFGDTSIVRMHLQPENLGEVSLKLSVTGNTITANIVAQNADVQNMLLSNQQLLARSLAEAGLSLGKLSVDVSGGNSGFTQQEAANRRALGKSSMLRLPTVAEDDTWTDSRFGPPVLTGSKAMVLNYLV